MLPSFIIVVALALLAVGVWWIVSLRRVKTVLRRVADPRNPEVIQRVYVERPGLRAKLWFEASANSPNGFVVHFRGNSEDFTVTPLGAEPIQIQEAREALNELGLDLEKSTWDQIVERPMRSAACLRTTSSQPRRSMNCQSR